MSFILEKFKSFNSKNAIVFEDRIYSYKEFVKQIKDYKDILDKHNISSKVVVILGDYSFYNLALFFALYENKNIIVPITSNIKIKGQLGLWNVDQNLIKKLKEEKNESC